MIPAIMDGARVILQLLADPVMFLLLVLRPRCALAAETLFLRKQLEMYRERGPKPRRIDAAIQTSLVLVSRLFECKREV